jgi:hypothetical protein
VLSGNIPIKQKISQWGKKCIAAGKFGYIDASESEKYVAIS